MRNTCMPLHTAKIQTSTLAAVLPAMLWMACAGAPADTSGSGSSGAASSSSLAGSTSGTCGVGACGASSASASGAVGSGTSTSGTGGSSSGSSVSGNACALLDNTEPDGRASPSGCARRTRDISSCMAARQAQGLDGFWLRFSCRVTLTKTQTAVTVASDGQPDHPSNYFPAQSACHEAYQGGTQNPNFITVQQNSLTIPLAPNMTSTTMRGGAVGMALNGVVLFSNAAAPGDDIFLEAATFDRCGAHPQMTGVYHYHGEPYAISYDDAAFIGVMRDGYPVYGRYDADGSTPTLDSFGGHSGVTGDSVTPTYHYHLHEETSVAATSAGQTQWFLTTGTYRGTAP